MKKFIKLVILLVSFIVALSVFTACTDPGDGAENAVVITVENVSENVTLEAYMTDAGVDFKVENGMITEINGKANTTNSFWMLYTSDAENSNTAWGSYEHEGVTLGSAAVGATELVVKNGCVYVWVYETF